jgi:predicted phosphodiesterase
MRYAILSDIHANLEGLRQVLHTLRNESIDTYYCLGDIVGYGANPNECVEEIRRIAHVSLAGNHDWAAVGLYPIAGLNDYARAAVEWTQSVLEDNNSSYLKSLPLVFKNQSMTMAHGTLINPGEFYYMSDSGSARETFKVMEGNACFVGHTHVAGVFVQDGKGNISFSAGPVVSIEQGKKYIINAGSVGQPRDHNPESAYCIYDTGVNAVEIKRCAYDVAAAAIKIFDAGLPPFLADRITRGQ